jgi:hypothetical protein
MLAVNVRKRKVLTVTRDNDTGNGRQNLTYYVYEINSKIFFLSRHFIFGGSLFIKVLLLSGKYGVMPIYLCRCKRFLQNTGK